MDAIPKEEEYTDTRNTKKTFLLTDAICIDCGTIFNSVYEDQCVICDEGDQIDKADSHKDSRTKCNHINFVTGKQSIDIRILLDFHIEDIMALCELHGCSQGSRVKMTANILKKLYPYLNERIDENLIRKIIRRNSKRFWYMKDIDTALQTIKSKKRLKAVDASECYEVKQIRSLKETK